MRIVLFVVLGIVVLIAGGVAFFPMSIAADIAAKQVPDFKFGEASGSVWDGKLTKVSYGSQYIGDLSVKTELLALLGGKAAGTLGLAREGFSGQASISYGIGDGGLDLKDMKIEGDTAMVPGMPPEVANSGGKFSLNIKDVKFAKGFCESANGEVWTDALTRMSVRGWKGPELRGPVTCAGGNLQVQAGGKAQTGEDVEALLSISPSLDMALTASVANASPGAAQSLTSMGFVPEGNRLVLHHGMSGQ
jgi:general secretion pathway protein N